MTKRKVVYCSGCLQITEHEKPEEDKKYLICTNCGHITYDSVQKK